MQPEDLVGLAIPFAFFTLWGLEVLANARGGGRSFPRVPGWGWVGLGFFLLTAVVAASAPVWLPPAWLTRHRLMDLTGLGVGWGTLVGYSAASLAMYWFHRAEHRFDLLWRGLHQMHHSVERVDMAAYAVGHPLEMVLQTVVLTGATSLILGLDPLAATLSATIGTVLSMVAHWNVSTPYWLGYVFLRPEQHCLHHERDVHARNYGGDFAIWDLLFGTWANVRDFRAPVGFGRPALAAMPAMLAFCDVNGVRDSEL